MTRMNYNHLHYFWMVAREGSVVRASEELMVSQPTISSQIRDLENAIGKRLFERAGRGLVLTEAGRIAFQYANEMFSLGQELLNAMERRHGEPALKVAVGILDVIPKLIVRRLLDPAMRLSQPVRLVCREDKADRLLADLAARRTDLVLSDSPIGTSVPMRGFNHLLGESDVAIFAAPALARRLRRTAGGFPKSLGSVPLLLPTEHTAMRRSLNLWFERRRIYPVVAGEFDDSATMYCFGRDGVAAFPAPALVKNEIETEYGVSAVGLAGDVRERYYAISIEDKVSHPAVKAISESARRTLSRG